MKGIMRLSAIAAVVISLASTASAGTVTGFFIGGEGLDLQPRNGDLDYLTIFPSTAGGNLSTLTFHPSYHWGYRVYGGLNFCNNEDVTFSYMRYTNNKTLDLISPVDADGDVVTSIPRFLPGSSWSNLEPSLNFIVEEVYGVAGHTSMIGPWKVRYAAGIEWAKIESDLAIQGIAGSTQFLQPTGVIVGYDDHSHIHGVGPRVEFDFAYALPYNLSAFMRTNMALLISSRNVSLENVNPTDDSENPQDLSYTRRHVIIPKIGMKLGLGFTYGVGAIGGEGAAILDNSTITIEAGWQTDLYIHAIERPGGFENVVTNSPANITTNTSNLGLEGFFIGAKLSIACL